MYYLLKFHISYLRWRLFLNSAISVCSRPCPLHLALPSLSVVSVSLLSCCLGVLLCDIHFNHFILHLVAHRWALDGWKFIKRSTDHYLPPENGLIDFVQGGGGNSLKVRTVFEISVVDHLHKLLLLSVRVKWSRSVWNFCPTGLIWKIPNSIWIIVCEYLVLLLFLISLCLRYCCCF